MVVESKSRTFDERKSGFVRYMKSFNKGEKVNNLFALNFGIMATNSLLMPVRESLTLEGGKQLQTRLMMFTVVVSMGGQALFAYYSGKNGGLQTLRICFFISSIFCIATYSCLIFAPSIRMFFSSAFYLWFTFYNMTSMSTFWAIAGDVLEESVVAEELKLEKDDNVKGDDSKIVVFSHLAAGGTLGHMTGSSLSTVLIREIGSKLCLLVLGMGFFLSISLCSRIESYRRKNLLPQTPSKETHEINISEDPKKNSLIGNLLKECKDQVANVGMIWRNPILFYSFMYSILLSTALGLTVIERTIAAKASGLSADEYAKVLAGNQTLHGALQFMIQFFGAGAFITLIGSVAALTAAGMARFLSFIAFFIVQTQCFPSISVWYSSHAVIPVTFVIIADLICRLTTQTISKPVRESLWVLIPKSNKYRSKIIVDVLAHRVGTSLAAFLANVPILLEFNKYLQTSSLFHLCYRYFRTDDSTEFIGFLGQDHILWGVLVTILLCFFAVCLGRAYNRGKVKSD